MENTSPPKKETMLLIETQTISRSQVITALSVFAFSLCIVFFFLQNKSNWIKEFQEATKGLQAENDSLRKQVAECRASDSLQRKFFFNHYFSPKDEKNFRLYALFKPKNKDWDSKEVADHFNVPARFVKVQENNEEEKSYIVPIKAIHWVRAEDTPESLAKLYYFDKNDVRLIQEFNSTFEKGKIVYIPFN